MERLIETDLEKLKTDMLTALRTAQAAVDKAVASVLNRDAAAADAAMVDEAAIDAMECALDAEILRLLALHQPVARDLRYILGCMRAVGDIERIGDQAANIAERGLILLKRPPAPISPTLREMADTTREFLVLTAACFTDQSLDLANRICAESEDILSLNTAFLKEMTAAMLEESRPMERAVQLCFIAHGLKRVCDQCTNIAESVVFMREGACSRHRCD
jgi:phosphate transport system protein